MPTHRFIFSLLRRNGHHLQSRDRWISSTAHLDNSWMNTIKGVFTGQKDTDSSQTTSHESFTLLRFAEELSKARKVGSFKNYIVGRSSAATFADAFEKQEAIIRFLGGFDPTGENILPTQKQEAAKRCNCTIVEVENTLAKFTWAKEAQRKIEKMKEEGKPLPTSLIEVLFIVSLNNLPFFMKNVEC
ncbi:uncharacterized protein LOC124942589 [Impatiens glandulifera]|uniref:uncharacterized protein LOC124942589 n=1 Tax=Impatiens glandulifera TaxID=253017 RepID=UPI001FB0F632|nr:uncharacterized protein LOC124942589 [Impatiens glandulifera]